MSFPEEPLDLLPTDGGGYFPACISQTLDNGRYTVIRKLGYGPRSSTWLVRDQSDSNAAYYAVKIHTIAASERAEQVEAPIMRRVSDIGESVDLPAFHRLFWEESLNGKHLCFVLNPTSTSVLDMQKQEETGRLPVHVVQKVIHNVADALGCLHGDGIMHGAVKPENFAFNAWTQAEHLEPLLQAEPAKPTTTIKMLPVVVSQPLPHTFRWKGKKQNVAGWGLSLTAFGHAQRPDFKAQPSESYIPEKGYNYFSAPETLLGSSSCSCETDIWMLGFTTFYLLTGGSPFCDKSTAAEAIAYMCVVLSEPADCVPISWRDDPKIEGFSEVAAGQSDVRTIEAALAEVLNETELDGAASFIKACLRVNPRDRMTAKEASQHDWLSNANACSCSFCLH